ncbi:MAG: hypothetical protein QNK19_16070 [Xanthomonadales bacterium]|nr:hypothetical protein [Xanthomonadales bacterium]
MHNWLLAGPWYRQQSLGGGAAARSQRPIIQKYASSDFATEIITDPEHSLRFVGEDFVNNISLPPNDPVTPVTPGVGNNSLKLFLDSHSRFYVVVCELHCDAAGYPNVAREQVAEAGFVIRRFATQLNETQRKTLQPVLKQRALLQAKINRVNRGLKGLYSSPSGGPGKLELRKNLNKKQSAKLTELSAALEVNSVKLQTLKKQHKVDVEAQGWIASEHKGRGNWQTLDDEVPQQLTEQSFPLYPLIADPTLEQHAAQGRTLWYGVIPTQSSDVDDRDAPRFDDESGYEIRSFVRRQPECDKDSDICCPGDLIWSQASESYRLAEFYDLDGCGHKPINIKMPNLNNLKQQVARGPVGKGANVRVTTPENSGVSTTTGEDFGMPEPGAPGGNSICFFAIPLITIVAMFLLRLVLPIVVFLFNLWFLLSLRLCIPPSISFDAGLAADLKLIPPEFDFDAEFSAGASLEIGGELVSSFNELANALESGFDKDDVMDPEVKDAMFARLRAGNDVHDILRSMVDMGSNYGDGPVLDDEGNELDPQPISATLAKASDGLHYFDPVEQAS